MTIRIIFWKIQKVLTRLAQLLYPNFDQISSRKHKSDSIITLKISEEHVGLDNYKNLPETDFRRILEIKNSILNPKTGLIWLNKKIIKESSYWNINELIKWEPYPYFPNRLSGTYNFLPDNGFFHFLIEDLPRFIETNDINPSIVTIAGSHAKYITDSLDILKPNAYITHLAPVKVDSIIFSEKISGQVFSKYDLKLIKEVFSLFIKSNQNESVFISRADTKGDKFKSRGIDLKYIIEDIFLSFGFKIVYLEKLNLIDQISMMSRSRRIAGFHGAGLANIIWADQAHVMEISKTRSTRHFEHLANISSNNYLYFSTLNSLSDLRNKIEKMFN